MEKDWKITGRWAGGGLRGPRPPRGRGVEGHTAPSRGAALVRQEARRRPLRCGTRGRRRRRRTPGAVAAGEADRQPPWTDTTRASRWVGPGSGGAAVSDFGLDRFHHGGGRGGGSPSSAARGAARERRGTSSNKLFCSGGVDPGPSTADTCLAMPQGQRIALESELKDQQEAMDALMDMLEKTITVEVPLPSFTRKLCRLARRSHAACSAGHARPFGRAGNAAWAAAEHSRG